MTSRFGIIFCSTEIMVRRAGRDLHARGYAADRLHGDITQMQRNRVMDKFRQAGLRVPRGDGRGGARTRCRRPRGRCSTTTCRTTPKTTRNRIGRTGRAGKVGPGVHVCVRPVSSGCSRISSAMREVEDPPRRTSRRSTSAEEARENVFSEKLRDTLNAAKFRKQRPHDRPPAGAAGYPSTDICSALIHLLQGGGGSDKPEGKPAALPPTSAAPSWATKKAAPVSAGPAVGAPAAKPDRGDELCGAAQGGGSRRAGGGTGCDCANGRA